MKIIVLRYGELTLKGRNKKEFINILAQNLQVKLQDYPCSFTINKQEIKITQITNFEQTLKQVKTLFGISRILVFTEHSTLEDAYNSYVNRVQKIKKDTTFRITVKRRNKKFPKNSQVIQRELATRLLKSSDKLSVDLVKYQKNYYLEISENFRELVKEYSGLGGLPVGAAGKAIAMISGGIDSPVAIYLAMKRGLRIHALHFETPPYTSQQARNKIVEIVKTLRKYDPKMKLSFYNLTPLQTIIHQNGQSNNLIVTLRNYMFSIAEQFGYKNDIYTIITGENLSQVASQTAENMRAAHANTKALVIQPLITFDKNEIIKIAEKINTYEISIQPFDDFCTIFAPKSPILRMKYDVMQKIRYQMDQKIKNQLNIYDLNLFTKEN